MFITILSRMGKDCKNCLNVQSHSESEIELNLDRSQVEVELSQFVTLDKPH
jgi:hypothetical protein